MAIAKADVSGPARATPGTSSRPAGPIAMASIAIDPHALGEAGKGREKFLPVTRAALLHRLTQAKLWPNGDAAEARRFIRYLDFWRRQSYTARLLEVEQAYEPFAPDTDLKSTRAYTLEERLTLQKRVVSQMEGVLQRANFTRVNPGDVHLILTKDSHYGLDLQVDLDAFEEALIYFRGATTITERRRDIKRAYIGWKEVKVPVFQRLFLLFKLKPFDVRVAELMEAQKIPKRDAEKIVRRMRGLLPATVTSDHIYMKLFKNMPRTDVEMIFPNTKVRFRTWDKIRFGVSASGGVGMGVFGAIGKIALMSNPVTLFTAIAGFGGILVRQATNFIAQRNRYMVVMAQNLYFHSMADNRGVMTLLADRAAEEDIKEEMLLYAMLARERLHVSQLSDADARIEAYLKAQFGVDVDFDEHDALSRLKAEGIVTETADGMLETLPPAEAARHIDQMWDHYLDKLPDMYPDEGTEINEDADTGPAL